MATNTDTTLGSVNAPRVVRESRNPLRLTWHILRRYPVLPAFIVAVLIIAAVFAPWLARHDPLVGKLRDQDRPPIWQESSPISGKEPLWEYPLGTDPSRQRHAEPDHLGCAIFDADRVRSSDIRALSVGRYSD